MTDPVPDAAEVRRDPTAWEPRTVYVRLSARRFFDNHGPLGLSQVNEQPQMPDGGHATRLVAIDSILAASPAASLSPAPGGRPEDYEPRTYGGDDSGFTHTLAATGPARVIFDVLHPDANGGFGFAIKSFDSLAIDVAEALIDAGYIDRLSASPAPLPDDEERTDGV